MKFFKNNWIYIIVAFSVVFLIGIGYITYTRLNQLNVNETALETQQQAEPTPYEDPANQVELTFQITPAVLEVDGLECIELVATPLEGQSPLTVSFTGLAGDTSSSMSFIFDFGDSTNETIKKEITSTNGIVTQLTTHTYTDDGTYEAALTVQSENGEETSSACTISISVGETTGLTSAPTQMPTTQPTLIAQAPSITPTRALSLSPSAIPTRGIGGVNPSPSPSPLITSTVSKTPTPTSIPTIVRTLTPTTSTTPTQTTSTTVAVSSNTTAPTRAVAAPNVPEAGSFLPTVLAGIGGIAILILAFAML
jgi:PKD repeat protein